MTEAERLVLDGVSIDEPWPLVECFAEIVREAPEEVNRAGWLIVERLTALGVPVTAHEPKLYLSLPKSASVQVGERTLRAKPPSFAASHPDGVAGRLVIVRTPTARPLGFAPGTSPLFGAGYESLPSPSRSIATRRTCSASRRRICCAA